MIWWHCAFTLFFSFCNFLSCVMYRRKLGMNKVLGAVYLLPISAPIRMPVIAEPMITVAAR